MVLSVTAAAHPNLALVKYWGQQDHRIYIPINNSISVNLSALRTVTTVAFDPGLSDDVVTLNTQPADQSTHQRVSDHLDRIRVLAGINDNARVVTRNDFPLSVGFASSASGFAALSLAASRAAGLVLSEHELSILARKGSGSACRSIPDGFVEWQAGYDDATSFAVSIASRDYWQLAVVSVPVSHQPKNISSLEGHIAAQTSPFIKSRLAQVTESLRIVREGLRLRDITELGMAVEREAVAFHAIAMTSRPLHQPWMSGIYYWEAETIRLIQAVQRWRYDGLPVYFTLDAGPTVHLLCETQHLYELIQSLHQELDWLQDDVIISYPGQGAWIIEEEP
jgi:diphosphomevalonate decarboxylase